VAAVLPFRMFVQPVVSWSLQRSLSDALAAARTEHAPLTTPQPDQS
jgi:hypothetical protein